VDSVSHTPRDSFSHGESGWANGAHERSPFLAWSPRYEVDIGPHVFPTSKYRLVREALLEAGRVRKKDFLEPKPASWEDVARVHSEDYLTKIREGALSLTDQMVLELPFSPQLREASLLCCGGTTQVALFALDDGVGIHLGGGFHHAFQDHGEGFCLLNDAAVALRTLLDRGAMRRGAVVDLDVHHGNGTAAIFSSDSRVFTFSMHQERNYPFPKPAGDLDIALSDGVRDEAYLRSLEAGLATTIRSQDPELILYLAGADPYVEDQLGGLALTRKGLEARDRMVLEECARMQIPVAVLLAGGYARRWEDTVRIHARTIEVALEVRDGW
jgi:acetoin utilization deacetylase AcuC-like enzyme